MSQHPYGLQYIILFFCSLGTFSGFTKGWKFLNLLFITVYFILYKKILFFFQIDFHFLGKKYYINPLWNKMVAQN